MGRALALARAARGDRVIAIGSNAAKGRALAAADNRIEFLRVDLSSVAETQKLVAQVRERRPDALALFANRLAPRRTETADGLEATFAVYYLSRYLLSHGLRDDVDVIVNVAGVGTTKGHVHFDDLQLAKRYRMIDAQLQAGRANDLLGVDFAHSGARARYVLYHPGFTRSGDLSPLPAPMRVALRTLARFKARPIADAVRPIVDWVDDPPAAPLTAIDRVRPVPASTPTLDPANAARLAAATEKLLSGLVGDE
jgi:hypothetical protein